MFASTANTPSFARSAINVHAVLNFAAKYNISSHCKNLSQAITATIASSANTVDWHGFVSHFVVTKATKKAVGGLGISHIVDRYNADIQAPGLTPLVAWRYD